MEVIMIRSGTVLLICLAMTMAITASGRGQPLMTVTLDMNSLPTEQGWSFVTTGQIGSFTETDIFSVAESVLVQNTMPMTIGLACDVGSTAGYTYDLSAYSSEEITGWRLTVEVRLLDSEVQLYHYGFSASGFIDGYGTGFGLSLSGLQDRDLEVHALDSTQWHHYQILADYNLLSYDLYVDGAHLKSGDLETDTNTSFRIGDGSCTANANAEIRYVRAELNPDPLVLIDRATWGGVKALFR
jgi:hypothetical protein